MEKTYFKLPSSSFEIGLLLIEVEFVAPSPFCLKGNQKYFKN